MKTKTNSSTLQRLSSPREFLVELPVIFSDGRSVDLNTFSFHHLLSKQPIIYYMNSYTSGFFHLIKCLCEHSYGNIHVIVWAVWSV